MDTQRYRLKQGGEVRDVRVHRPLPAGGKPVEGAGQNAGEDVVNYPAQDDTAAAMPPRLAAPRPAWFPQPDHLAPATRQLDERAQVEPADDPRSREPDPTDPAASAATAGTVSMPATFALPASFHMPPVSTLVPAAGAGESAALVNMHHLLVSKAFSSMVEGKPALARTALEQALKVGVELLSAKGDAPGPDARQAYLRGLMTDSVGRFNKKQLLEFAAKHRYVPEPGKQDVPPHVYMRKLLVEAVYKAIVQSER